MQLVVSLKHNDGEIDHEVVKGEDESEAGTAARAALLEMLETVPYLAAGDKLLITVTAD